MELERPWPAPENCAQCESDLTRSERGRYLLLEHDLMQWLAPDEWLCRGCLEQQEDEVDCDE